MPLSQLFWNVLQIITVYHCHVKRLVKLLAHGIWDSTCETRLKIWFGLRCQRDLNMPAFKIIKHPYTTSHHSKLPCVTLNKYIKHDRTAKHRSVLQFAGTHSFQNSSFSQQAEGLRGLRPEYCRNGAKQSFIMQAIKLLNKYTWTWEKFSHLLIFVLAYCNVLFVLLICILDKQL